MSLEQLLCLHPFFDDLDTEHNAVIARIARPVEFQDGEHLFRQGDSADSAYFILSGRVAVMAKVPGGADINLAELCQRDMVGELALIENHRRSASAIAAGRVETLCIDNRDLSSLCAHYHPASLLLMHRLALTVAKRVRDSTKNSVHSAAVSNTYCDEESEQHVVSGTDFEIRPFLPSLDFFTGFSTRDIDDFLELCHPFTVPRGHSVELIGVNRRSAWLIVRGSMESSLQGEDGVSRASVLGPGSMVGEIDWLLDEETALSATTLTHCTLLELPVSAQSTLLSSESHLAFRFFQSLLRNLMHQLGTQVRDSARKEQIRLSGTLMLTSVE